MSGDTRLGPRSFRELLGRLRTASSGSLDRDEHEPGIGVLAYLGDSVYELWVRLELVAGGQCSGSALHRGAVQRVRAESQAAILRQMERYLTADELDLVRRARNAKVGVVPKSARPVEYRLATAFEALLGHLFWSCRLDRLVQLLVLSEDSGPDLEDDE